MTTRARPSFRMLVRLVAVAPVLASLTVVAAVTRVGPAIGRCAQASTMHHAALVVEHSDGSGHGAGPVIRVCVAFSEDTISGDTLLARSGVQYGTGDSGQAVCQLDYEPSSYPPQCLSPGAPYWAMYVSRAGGSWAYSSQGFATQQFHDGDAEGFRYEGQSDGAAPPSPAGVCPPATPPTAPPTRPPSTTAPRRTVSPATGAPAAPTPTPTPTGVAAAAPSPPTTTASGTDTARPATAVTSSNRSAPLPPAGSGAWVAAVLGVGLVAALMAQLARARRRGSRRAPP
jgi:hypothetical protein